MRRGPTRCCTAQRWSPAQLHWPELVVRITLVLLTLGLPVAILLAWYHGHTKAQHRISGPELAMLTVLLIIAGTILLVVSRYSGEHEPAVAATSTATPTNLPTAPRTAVAVLPFANLTGAATKEYLGRRHGRGIDQYAD